MNITALLSCIKICICYENQTENMKEERRKKKKRGEKKAASSALLITKERATERERRDKEKIQGLDHIT